jgi:hypothetical protein
MVKFRVHTIIDLVIEVHRLWAILSTGTNFVAAEAKNAVFLRGREITGQAG